MGTGDSETTGDSGTTVAGKGVGMGSGACAGDLASGLVGTGGTVAGSTTGATAGAATFSLVTFVSWVVGGAGGGAVAAGDWDWDWEVWDPQEALRTRRRRTGRADRFLMPSF